MKVKKLLRLISNSTEVDNIKEGVIECYGYTFIFKDIKYIPKHLSRCQSGGVCSVGTVRKAFKEWSNETTENFNDFFKYDRKKDVLLAGSVKIIVPTLEFGGMNICLKFGCL